MEKKEYSVSEAVRLIGVESHVLRYWEEELPVEIHRNSQGHRVYSEEDIDTFRRVRNLKEKGLQLRAIRLLMDEEGRFDPGNGAQGTGFAKQIRELAGECEVREHGGDRGERRAEECMEEPAGEPAGEPQEERVGETEGEAEKVSCEIVLLQDQNDDLYRFRQILRRLIEEVVSEQNERLKEALAGQMKEELEDFYLQCCQIMRETAASEGLGERAHGRVGRVLRRLFGMKK